MSNQAKPAKRKQITEPMVWRAVEDLLAQGERPTDQSIRDHLGGRGSFTSINKMLTRWYEQVGPALVSKVVNEDTEQARQLRTAMDHVLEIAREVARTELADQREAIEKERLQQDAAVAAVETERREMSESLMQLEKSLAKTQALNESLKSQNVALQLSETTLTERASKLEAHLQIEREDLRTAVAKAKALEGECQEGRLKIASLNQNLVHLNDELGKAKKLVEQTHQARAEIQAHLDMKTQAFNDQAQALKEATQRATTAELELANTRAKMAELKRQVTGLNTELTQTRHAHEKALAAERERLDRQIQILSEQIKPTPKAENRKEPGKPRRKSKK